MNRKAEFIQWLRAQVGSAYVWGAQGEQIRADGGVWLDAKKKHLDWRAWVDAKETSATNATRAKRFIEGRLAAGEKEVACFDCSGLIMRYVADIKGYIKGDFTANGIYGKCERIEKNELRPGDLLFRNNGKRIHHVGVYIGEGLAAEAVGRDAGVVIRPLDAAGALYWNAYGMLENLVTPASEQTDAARFAVCTGDDVNIRSGPGLKERILGKAHRENAMIATSPENGWARVAAGTPDGIVSGYMSANYIKYIGGLT